jgi:hypothetical protein
MFKTLLDTRSLLEVVCPKRDYHWGAELAQEASGGAPCRIVAMLPKAKVFDSKTQTPEIQSEVQPSKSESKSEVQPPKSEPSKYESETPDDASESPVDTVDAPWASDIETGVDAADYDADDIEPGIDLAYDDTAITDPGIDISAILDEFTPLDLPSDQAFFDMWRELKLIEDQWGSYRSSYLNK